MKLPETKPATCELDIILRSHFQGGLSISLRMGSHSTSRPTPIICVKSCSNAKISLNIKDGRYLQGMTLIPCEAGTIWAVVSTEPFVSKIERSNLTTRTVCHDIGLVMVVSEERTIWSSLRKMRTHNANGFLPERLKDGSEVRVVVAGNCRRPRPVREPGNA